MVTNAGFEEQIRRLLSDTKSELNTIDQQIMDLQEKKTILAKEVQGLETTLESYLRRTGKHTIVKDNWLESLGDKTHKEKLVEIAKRNSGRIRISDATDILYNAGLIKSKKRTNAYIIVQSLLKEMSEGSGSFKQVAPGKYKLVDVQQTLTLPKSEQTTIFD